MTSRLLPIDMCRNRKRMATDYGDLSHLLPAGWKAIVNAWFQEDCPSFDYGGFVVGETPETATLYGKSKVPRNLYLR
jgi:hypothetical protein